MENELLTLKIITRNRLEAELDEKRVEVEELERELDKINKELGVQE
jgi:hypothetical protein